MSEEGEVSSGGSEVSEGEEQQDDADVDFFEFKQKESSCGGELIACQGYEYTFEAKSKIILQINAETMHIPLFFIAEIYVQKYKNIYFLYI